MNYVSVFPWTCFNGRKSSLGIYLWMSCLHIDRNVNRVKPFSHLSLQSGIAIILNISDYIFKFLSVQLSDIIINLKNINRKR